MSPVSTTPGTRQAPPADLPEDLRQPELEEPAERQEAELTGRPNKPLLPAAGRSRQILILAAVVVVLVVLLIIFR